MQKNETAWETVYTVSQAVMLHWASEVCRLFFFSNGQAVCIAVNHKHGVRHEIVGDDPAAD